jgi:hypothetical protein
MLESSQSVIASRRFRLWRGEKASTHTAKIGLPRRARTGEWVCSCWISGLGDRTAEIVRGVDSVQAIVLAFEAIRQKLKTLKGRVSWPGSKDPMDFPQYVPIYYGPELTRRLERLIDREVRRTGRMLKARQEKPARRKRSRVASRKKVA